MTVITYNLIAGNGKKIRKATKVIFASGGEIKFTEMLSKKEAVKQARTIMWEKFFKCP